MVQLLISKQATDNQLTKANRLVFARAMMTTK